MRFADLLTPPPTQWGLRGDPVLWAALNRVFRDHPLPQNEAALLAEFDTALQALTQHKLSTLPDQFAVPPLTSTDGGLSNGVVDGVFWRETAMPLIVARYRCTKT